MKIESPCVIPSAACHSERSVSLRAQRGIPLCHSERSEESRMLINFNTMRFLAALGMTIYFHASW